MCRKCEHVIESCNASVFTPQAGCCSCQSYAEQKCLQIRPSSILSGWIRHSPNPYRWYSSHFHDSHQLLYCTFNASLFPCLHCDLSTSYLTLCCPNFILFSWSQRATIAGLMQIAAAAGMNRWSWGNAGNACKSDRSGLKRGRLMMLLWIILSSSLCLMVDGQMKISPETWVQLHKKNERVTFYPMGEVVLMSV